MDDDTIPLRELKMKMLNKQPSGQSRTRRGDQVKEDKQKRIRKWWA
jgi:hypothetical protein